MRRLFLLLLICITSIVSAQEATPESSAMPLGSGIGEIAFRSGRDAESGLYLMDVDGTNRRQLLDADYAAWIAELRWSPDGSELLFSTQFEGDWEIFLVNGDGTNVRPVIENDTEENWAIWSSDGSQILYTTDIDASKSMYLVNRDGSDSRRFMQSNAGIFYLDWHVSGDWVAYSRNAQGGLTEIYLVNQVGESQRFTEWSGQDFLPRWSPDGTKLAWISDRAGYPQVYMVDFAAALEELPLGDSPLIQLVSDLRRVSSFAWSPDGQYMAITANADPTLYDADIYIVNVATGESQQITHDSVSAIPAWH